MENKAPAKKRGSKQASLELNYKGKKEEIGKVILNNAKFFKATPCKSEDEIEERLYDFFMDYAENDSFPTVEKMALCLGISIKTLWDWQTGGHGSTPRKAELIKKAKGILAGIDAEMAQTGKVDRSVYIFRAKNFYGMSDVQQIEVAPTNPLGDTVNSEELSKRLLSATEIIDTDEQN